MSKWADDFRSIGLPSSQHEIWAHQSSPKFQCTKRPDSSKSLYSYAFQTFDFVGTNVMDKYNTTKTRDNASAVFLLDEDVSISPQNYSSDRKQWDSTHYSWTRRHRSSILFHVLLFLLNLSICVLYTSSVQSKNCHNRDVINCTWKRFFG